MFGLRKKKAVIGCECEDYCPCGAWRFLPPNRSIPRCEDCDYFSFSDSGYGYCLGLPTVVTVPWCKPPCSLFIEKKKKVAV